MGPAATSTLAIGVITNPNSRKNVGRADRAGELQQILGGRGVVRQTRSTAELADVLDEFRERGVRTWVTDGGDGSLHWLLNTASERFGGPAELAREVEWAVPANGGTIDFVARHVGLRGGAEDILRALVRLDAEGRRPETIRVPTLLLRGVREDAAGERSPFQRLGFAATFSGIASGFFDKYYAHPSGGGPRAIVGVMARAVVAVLVDGSPARRLAPGWSDYARVVRGEAEGRVWVDGQELPYRRLSAFNVGAFPIDLGGVVKVFGQARPGRPHVIAGTLSDLSMIRNVPRLVRGKSLRSSTVHDAPAAHVRAEALGRPFRAVVDGEFVDGIRELELTSGPTVEIPRLDAKAARR